MKFLSWSEFDDCVDLISRKCASKKFVGVYGFPRGGLCLAVALSHSLDIPLLKEPEASCLIVDDVYETGKTINTVKNIENACIFVWYSKVKPLWWKSVKTGSSNEWLVFPWEKQLHARCDEHSYKLSRSL